MFNLLFLYQLFNSPNTNEYNISHVQYMAKQSSSKYLSSVTFEGVDFEFVKENTEYVIEVPFSKKTLGLNYTLEDDKSSVQVIGDEELLLGNNSLVLLVTGDDGTTLEYKFTIIRKEDSSFVLDNNNFIKEALLGNQTSKLISNVTSKTMVLDRETVNLLSLSKKTIVFNWNDLQGNLMSSLTIEGKEIENIDSININVKNSITNKKLIDYLDNTEYISVSTVDTNIPKHSIYKMKIDAKDDLYYLYYYQDDLLVTKPIRVIDDMIEFEIESDVDYALAVKRPERESIDLNGERWIWFFLFVIILFIVFFVITKYKALKYIQNNHHMNKKSRK